MRATGLACVLFAALCGPAIADDRAQALTRMQTFTVQVVSAGNPAAIGSGVLVRRQGDLLTIVTAAHAVMQPGTLQILDVTRHALYQPLGIRVLLDYDLALVRVRAQPNFSVVPVTFGSAKAGEPVWIWGNHHNAFWTVANGSVQETSARLPGSFGSSRITITCEQCGPGDSGSGVFDEHGALIGILTKGWMLASNNAVVFDEVEPSALIAQEAPIVDGDQLLATEVTAPK